MMTMRHEQKRTWEDIATTLSRPIKSCMNKYYTVVRNQGEKMWSRVLDEPQSLASGAATQLRDAVCVYGEDWDAVGNVSGIHPACCKHYYSKLLKSMSIAEWSVNETALLHRVYFENVPQPAKGNSERSPLDLTGMDSPTSLRLNPSAAVQVYSRFSPAMWRNISHVLNRQSYDCRVHFLLSYLSKDVTMTSDVWFEGEVRFDHR